MPCSWRIKKLQSPATYFMGTIVLLKDLLSQKKRKEEELARYSGYLVQLKSKLDYIRKEIALTEKIISMVQKEEIVQILKE